MMTEELMHPNEEKLNLTNKFRMKNLNNKKVPKNLKVKMRVDRKILNNQNNKLPNRKTKVENKNKKKVKKVKISRTFPNINPKNLKTNPVINLNFEKINLIIIMSEEVEKE